jgi:phosphoribosyl-ATP pyrophosphohydrolase
MYETLERIAPPSRSARAATRRNPTSRSCFAKGDDAMLKKIGEEATETVLAAKSGDRLHLVRETADLWFHCMIVLARHGLGPRDVLAEMHRREGISGLDEKGGAKEMTDPELHFLQDRARRDPGEEVHDDDDVMAFHDIRPQAPVHFLIVPRRTSPPVRRADAAPARSARCSPVAASSRAKAGAADGFRTIINTGRVGHQEVYHVHMHVLGGPEPLGPMLLRRT